MAGSSHDPLQSPAVASGAVSKPGGDAAGQDALHSAGVEGSEDAGAHSKLPQPSQEEEALMCLLQHCICVSRPCEILGDVNAEELKAVYPLHRCLVDGDVCVFSALSPVIHHQLLGLVDVECGVKCRTIIHEQHPHIGVLIFQVGESSVQAEGNSIVCGTVTAICKL